MSIKHGPHARAFWAQCNGCHARLTGPVSTQKEARAEAFGFEPVFGYPPWKRTGRRHLCARCMEAAARGKRIEEAA